MQDMLQRTIASSVQKALQNYPAVALLGPRQCGKTTLAKALRGVYFDLEQPQDRLRLEVEWESLTASRRMIILDEAQEMPEIFPRIRGAIDAKRKSFGRFLILGSIAPALMKNVSESLAGRLAICELSPFLLPEIPKKIFEDTLWSYGGFPDGGILSREKTFGNWQSHYLTLLAQRDLPHWGLPSLPETTWKLFKMLAVFHGQIWNASSAGSSLGLSYHTVARYLGFLQNVYLITLLQPYHVNLKKRLVKSPKLYWNDSGLLHFLLGLERPQDLFHQPWVGASWEGWCIQQILWTLKAAGKRFEAFYFRTSDGYEVDLVLLLNQKLWAFEFKLTSSPSSEDFHKFNQTSDLLQADKRILITRSKNVFSNPKLIVTNLRSSLQLITE